MESNMLSGSGVLRGSIRWAFNTKAWDPTEQEWLLASRCIQLEEKERINKFVFKSDAKASIAGRLLMRKFAHLATGEPYNTINIGRDKDGRPFIENSKVPVDFNVSHQGSFTVLAGEVGNDSIVGVDIMNLERKTGHQLSEFFRLMSKTFTQDEWSTILASHLDDKRSAMFFRHWCLKESYLKATGVGIRMDLRRISFRVNTSPLSHDKPCVDTTVEVDGVQDSAWRFHEWLLEPDHCVTVALSNRSRIAPNILPLPFSVLSWCDLIKESEPLLPPDLHYCQDFMKKDESPGTIKPSLL